MKIKSDLFLMSCILAFQSIWASEFSLHIDKQIYQPGDTIKVIADLTHDWESEASYVLEVSVTSQNRSQPEILIPYQGQLIPGESKSITVYEAYVSEDFPSDDYQVHVRFLINGDLLDEDEVFFQVRGTLRPIDFTALTCKDAECLQPSTVFLMGDIVHIHYASSIADIHAEGFLILPDDTRREIMLPTEVQVEKVGTYNIEVTATKEGYQQQIQKLRFVVIDKEPQIPVLHRIGEIKSQAWQDYVGKTVTIEGVFVRDPIPLLVTQLDLVRMNKPIPPNQYIILLGDQALRLDPKKYGGAKLRVSGTVVAIDDSHDLPGEYVGISMHQFEVLERLKEYAPEHLHFNYEYNPLPQRYAILFSGGSNKTYNYTRYWNDLKFMYSTLVNKYGFTDKTIAVLYADGVGRDKNMPVHYSATLTNLTTVFNLLKQHATDKDLIFIFTTNHGGGFEKDNTWDPISGGRFDSDGDEGTEPLFEKNYNLDMNGDLDKNDQFSWDEDLCCWGGVIFDDNLRTLFNDLNYDKLIILMEQCFSGGLILDIGASNNNMILISAAHQYESSWGMTSGLYDEFSYYFTCALNGADPQGIKVNADKDGDKKISMVEAFNYAYDKDTQNESPQYEDSGDGISHNGKMPASGEGTLGATTFLK
jgi:hypothetical protein